MIFGGISPLADLWELIKTAGPFSTAFIAVITWFLYREWKNERKKNDALHAAALDYLLASKKEDEIWRERVLKALHDAAVVISSASENIEAVKSTVSVVMETFVRSRRRG